ncbi:uncharacterized protein LOC129952083 [Eupeodes corollae]|uniref:uncharacterized protein LOC129952083 n=1 Tax=Eupeodes corollae TaxID=290404 RepID=UPI00248F7F20|nr:uncharacterized protein LOC129952083 [Eupeodes corollae]
MIIILRMVLFNLIAMIMLESGECRKSKPVDFKFLSMSTISNPELLKYCNVGITPGSNGRSFDMNAYLLTNITKNLYIGLKFYTRSKKETEYKEFFDYGFNICRLMEGFMSQTVARLWSANLKKFSNLPTTCPIRHGEYYVRKMRIDKKSVPMVAISGIYMAKVHLYIKNGPVSSLIANTSLEAEINF